jgi:hypothetical protein
MRDAGYATSADLIDFKINTTPSPTGATLLGTINRSKSLTPVETGADGWYYYEFSIPTSFNTATNYIIFSAVSQYGDNMFLDDVSVFNLLTTDAGTYTIDVATPQTPGVISPKATVKNFGSVAQTFPVTMTITGGYTNTQTVTSLAPGATLQVTFGNWTAANGSYTVKVYTQLTGDLDHSNDTLYKGVTISAAGWTNGAVCPSPQSLGEGIGYSKNDSGWVFSIGGQAGLTPVTKYNVRANTWSTVAPLPAGNDRFGVAILKDSVYVIGGANASSVYQSTVYKYDINANTWVTRASLPGIMGWNKCVGYQDSLIYCAGGYNGTATSSQVLLYNSNTNTWRTATSLPAIRFSGGFSRIGDTLVYSGGVDGSVLVTSTYIGVISQTDRSVITWTTGAALPTALFRTDAAPWGCKGIILSTGATTTSWTSGSSGLTYVFSPYQNAWTQLATATTPLMAAHLGTVNLGQNKWKLVVACGYNNGTTYGTTQIFSDSLNCSLVGVGNNSSTIPTVYSLTQNYPNPFNPVTRISYALPKDGFVTLRIYDIMGREVRTLVNEYKTANTYSVEFNASDLSSGVYFYKINVNGYTEMKKMMLIK